MTMHLVGPWMTTTSTRKIKSKKSKRQLNADIEHDKWLCKMGVTDNRSLAQPGGAGALGASGRRFESCNSDQIPLSNKIVAIEPKKTIDTETKMRYSSRYVVGQAYNKGGIQVLSSNETKDPNTGKRR